MRQQMLRNETGRQPAWRPRSRRLAGGLRSRRLRCSTLLYVCKGRRPANACCVDSGGYGETPIVIRFGFFLRRKIGKKAAGPSDVHGARMVAQTRAQASPIQKGQGRWERNPSSHSTYLSVQSATASVTHRLRHLSRDFFCGIHPLFSLAPYSGRWIRDPRPNLAARGNLARIQDWQGGAISTCRLQGRMILS
jgi:hypothetical protein